VELKDMTGEAIFCNFEQVRYCQPASDLAILLYTSTEKSLRCSILFCISIMNFYSTVAII
jgi:Ecdysteroid kinase-like family